MKYRKNSGKINFSSNGGMDFLSWLLLVFIVLKLTNLINWSWPVVLIPLWIDLGILAIVIIYIIILELRGK